MATSRRWASGSAPWPIRATSSTCRPKASPCWKASTSGSSTRCGTGHPSHFHLDLTLEWIDRIKPKRAILTNMHSDLDFEELRAKLPPNVEPGYDGLRAAFAG